MLYVVQSVERGAKRARYTLASLSVYHIHLHHVLSARMRALSAATTTRTHHHQPLCTLHYTIYIHFMHFCRLNGRVVVVVAAHYHHHQSCYYM